MKTTNHAQKTETRRRLAISFAIILTVAFLTSSGKSSESLKLQTQDFMSDNSMEFRFIPEIESQPMFYLICLNDLPISGESKVNHKLFWIKEEQDVNLKIESWMLNPSLFNCAESFERIDEEKPPKIESWMTDNKIWK